MAMQQEPIKIGGTYRTIYKAYCSGLNFREYPHNSYGLKNGTKLVPPFQDPEISIDFEHTCNVSDGLQKHWQPSRPGRVLNKEVELPLDASPDPSISQRDVPDDQ